MVLTKANIKEFRRLYTKASDAGHKSFFYEEQEVLCSYAFYVLQFYYQNNPNEN